MEELDGMEKSTLKIFKSITMVHEAGMVTLEVSSNRALPPRRGERFLCAVVPAAASGRSGSHVSRLHLTVGFSPTT